MRTPSTIVIPEADLHLAYNDDYQRTLKNEYLYKHVVQAQGVRVTQVTVYPQIYVERSTNTVRFEWSVTPEPTEG